MRGGRIVEERFARHVRSFPVHDKQLDAMSIGGTEAYGLPLESPSLSDVTTYLGWLGPLTRPAAALSGVQSALNRVPGIAAGLDRLTDLASRRTGTGPDEAARGRGRSHVVAVVSDADGRLLSDVHLEGIDGYTYTGRIMAWAAMRVAAGEVSGTGALAPAQAFGLEALEAGNAEVGLHRV